MPIAYAMDNLRARGWLEHFWPLSVCLFFRLFVFNTLIVIHTTYNTVIQLLITTVITIYNSHTTTYTTYTTYQYDAIKDVHNLLYKTIRLIF